MRLLYLENSFGYLKRAMASGGPRRMVEIGKRLLKLGVDVNVLTTTTGCEQFKELGLDTKYYVLAPFLGLEKAKHMHTALLYIFSYLYEIIRVLPIVAHLHRHNIIYTSSDFPCDTVPAWLYKKKHPRAKWITFVHHMIDVPSKRRGNPLINVLSYLSQQVSFRLIRDRADLIFLLETKEGLRVKSHLLELGIDQQKIVFTENGVDNEFIKKVSVQDGLYDICCSVALQAVRGAFDIVLISKQICSQKNDTHIIILAKGSPKAVASLRLELEREGLSNNVRLLKFVPWETYLRILKSSRVYLSLKYEEGWGIATCEAMACGLPVVAYDLPAYRVFGDAIVKVPKGDTKAFARAVINLLSNEELRRAIGKKANDTAGQFDWDKIARKELVLIQKLVAN